MGATFNPGTLQKDANGNPIQEGTPLAVREHSVADSGNSSTTPLAADAVFTGSWFDTKDFSVIQVTVSTDVASATDGLMVEWSSDGVTKRGDDVHTISAGANKPFSFQPVRRYCRVKYTNGSTIQGHFDLETQMKADYVKPSSHRIGDPIIDDDDAELVTNVNKAKQADGTFVNIGASTSGNLQVTDAENGLAIAKGEVAGTSFIHKFGSAPDIDVNMGFSTIWDGADDGGTDEPQYNYSTTADIDTVSSSNAGDTQVIEVQGLDTNYDLVVQNATLNGQNKVTLTTSLIRVFRIKNQGSADFIGDVYVYVDTTISGGVPTDTSQIRARVQNGNNQTLMAVFTIPQNKTGYLRDWYVSGAKGSASLNVTTRLVVRPFGGVFQLKHENVLNTEGTSYIRHDYVEPEVIPAKADVELRALTSANTVSVKGGFDIVLVDD